MDEDYSPSTKSPAALSMEPIESSVMTQILPLQCFRSSLHNCSCVTMPRPTSRSSRIEASGARWRKSQQPANKRHPTNARWVGGMFVGKLKIKESTSKFRWGRGGGGGGCGPRVLSRDLPIQSHFRELAAGRGGERPRPCCAC